MRSDQMKSGSERAPHRSLMKALGLTDREIAAPLIGVVNSANGIIPGMSISTVLSRRSRRGSVPPEELP